MVAQGEPAPANPLPRAERPGQDFAIPLHRMHNGALLLFDFFAVSDRMTHMNAGCAGLTYAERGALSA